LEDYWQLMTDEEIYKTSLSPNITIGSHGFYHNNLGSLATADAVSEVMQSKKYLEGIIQKEVLSIGYPDGSYTQQLNDALKEHSVNEQFVVDYKYNDAGVRDFAYDRIGLYPFMGNNNEILYKILHQ
jgi:peptidoglycan/xylan/chitin deacetylase (PgdA/CDA1 family)